MDLHRRFLSPLRGRQAIGQRFRLARKAVGLRSQAAADELKISRTYLSNIENGTKENISLEVLFNAAMLYGVSPAYLLGLALPPYAEVANALYVRGLLPPWYHEGNFELCRRVCAEVGFDPDAYCQQLGLEWDVMGPLRLLADHVQAPESADLPKTKDDTDEQ